MKRFLLVAVIALMTLSVSAKNRMYAPKGMLANEKKAAMCTPGAFKSFAAKQQAMAAFYSDYQPAVNKAKYVKKASLRAEDEELVLIPTYSQWTYFYSTIMGGFIPKIMEDRAQFLVTGDGRAFLAPFADADLGVVMGEKNEEAENPYAEYGAEVYTFTSDVIAKYTDPETSEVVELSLEPCVIENYTPYRSGETTFNGYYFPEDNELYFPSDVTLALFVSGGSEREIFDEFFVVRMLDLIPQETYNEYISKGTFTGTSYYGSQYDMEGECQILLGSDYYCVKGADGSENPDAWVEYDIDESDNTIAVVTENQYCGTFNFYNDETRTDTHPGVLVTVGLLQKDGELTGFNSSEEYSSSYKITDTPEETTIIENTNNTVYGDYVFMDEPYKGGMYEAMHQTVVITYEPIETGIKTVTSEKNSKFDGVTYNLAGQRVSDTQKGLVIKNGRKVVIK
jgi:hypothetical protein